MTVWERLPLHSLATITNHLPTLETLILWKEKYLLTYSISLNLTLLLLLYLHSCPPSRRESPDETIEPLKRPSKRSWNHSNRPSGENCQTGYPTSEAKYPQGKLSDYQTRVPSAVQPFGAAEVESGNTTPRGTPPSDPDYTNTLISFLSQSLGNAPSALETRASV